MIFDYISKKNALPFEQQIAQNFTSDIQWSQDLTLGIVFAGELTLHYEMHQRDFKLHDLFFFMPMQSFSVISSTPDAKVLLITIDNQFLTQLCPDFSKIHFQQNHLRANTTNEVYLSICREIANIIFNNLKTEATTHFHLLLSSTCLATILIESFGIVSEDSNISKNSDNNRNINILRFIEEHYSEHLSVSDIANHLGLHPQYFSSYFRKEFGTNFIEYLNTYRVNHSLRDLCYSNESVLNIALKYGFNSHKTYATMFKKLYDCTPLEYRKSTRHTDNKNQAPAEITPENPESSVGIFAYFRQFLYSDRSRSVYAAIQSQAKREETIELRPQDYANKIRTYEQCKIISVGRAFACLRSEVQKQIIQAKEDFDFDYLRIRDIFSDDLYVYYEDENKKSIYSWQALDNIFDFVLSIGAKPFPELGYMPSAMASKKQFAGVNYHPNVSAPKNIESWTDMVKAFLFHFIERYGLSEVESWLFDFWTSPDLKTKNPYWNGTQEEFFDFYHATYKAFQAVSPNLKLGSANFSTVNGYSWYEDFFQYCFAHKIYPSFVDFHVYGAKPRSAAVVTDSFLNIHTENFSVSDTNYILTEIGKMHEIMNRTGFRSLDVIVSDWNLTFMPKDLIRDTCFMGPYICHNLIHSIGQVKAMCFWTLSDIHEDAFPESRLFTGGPGMLDYHGLRKASYNTIFLLSTLGNRILTKGPNYIFVQKGSRYQLLIYNLAEFDAMFSTIDQSAMDEAHRYQIYNADYLYISLVLVLPAATYYIKRSEVNRKHGSAYDMWNEMGAPEVLHKEMEDYLRTNSTPHVTFSVENVEQTLLLEEEIPAHGVLLLEFIPKT